MNKAIKRIFIAALCVLLALVLVVASYAVYVFATYYRIGNTSLAVNGEQSKRAEAGKEYSLVTWNVGFGAYSDDFSFFMDGGTESRAFSKQAVLDNLNGVVARLQAENPDFMFIQEVDIGATRSYQVDEAQILTDALSAYNHTFAQNYDSPYLFYPITRPHGASKSGLLSFSKYQMLSSERIEVPVESGFMKLLDLDRCYNKIEIAIEGDKKLYLYNIHFSAYTSDGTIADEQIDQMLADMSAEYEKGNYAICGGDFNKDLIGNSGEVFGVSLGEATWAQPFPREKLPQGFTLIHGLDEETPVPSCREANAPYEAGVSRVLTVDGFIASPNVTVLSSAVLTENFAYSDHNPVRMTFTLQ